VLSPSGDRDLVEGPLDPRLPLIVNGAYQVAPGSPVRTR